MNRLKPLALSLTLLGALAASPAFAEIPQPEIATAYAEKPGWAAQQFMVAAANPLAAEAGLDGIDGRQLVPGDTGGRLRCAVHAQ